jgi:uncharacterized membrane protein
VDGTGRLEAFSDGVMAIVVTLLILEIKVPQISVLTNEAALSAIISIVPKLISFLVSFLTVAIFWVNHHHFFHAIEKTDGTLLWHNNHLLFWITVIPFATACIGDYSTIPLVVALYGFVLCMGAIAFTLLGRYVYFHTDFLPEFVSMEERKKQFRRSRFGAVVYGLSVVTAFIDPHISLAIFILLPIYFFIPESVQIDI